MEKQITYEEERRREVGHRHVDLLRARVGEEPRHDREARVVGAREAAEPLDDLRRPRRRDAARAGADGRAVGDRVHQQGAEDDADGEEVREELQVGRVVADAADALVAVRLVDAERRSADLDAEEADARRQQRRQRARATRPPTPCPVMMCSRSTRRDRRRRELYRR